jgi:aspartate 4-decarboxylase
MMETKDLIKYDKLSPFEVKDKLIELAQSHHERMMLDAGRGNPNWVTTTPRHGFFQLGLFALSEAERSFTDMEHFGGYTQADGLKARFDQFIQKNTGVAGIDFLQQAVAYAEQQLGIPAADLLLQFCDAIIGNHYPVPDRMLKHCETICAAYIRKEFGAGRPFDRAFDLFATEGGTAAMTYVFQTLKENKLLKMGDTIAIGSPIFTPYLEIPRLNDYRFVEVEVAASEDECWQIPDSEIDKLLDPGVKAFFLVNPSNPPSVKLQDATIDRIAEIVKTKRPDLIILTDDVYGTFTQGFVSLFAAIPDNTIGVYSWSKYFGATGWRLGIIALCEGNVLDRMLAELPQADKDKLAERYNSITLEPEKLKMIDRFVADSRAVALNHTAGLSTPQQVFMSLLSLFCLMDKADAYKKAAQDLVARRYKSLYEALGIPQPADPNSAHYYTEIDIRQVAAAAYSQELADWIDKNIHPLDFVFRLADEEEVVLMPGGGFDAPKSSVRASLANLDDAAYTAIGKRTRELVDEFYQRWKAAQEKK